MSVEMDRQWFVYYKETEMGPFPETELLKKVKAGDFDDTAFVYTDGMSDWELVKDTALQKQIMNVTPIKTQVTASSTNLVEASSRFDSQTPSDSKVKSVDAESIGSAAGSLDADAQAEGKKATASVFGLKSIAAILFFAFLGTGYLLNKNLVDSFLRGGNSNNVIDLSAQTPLPQTVNEHAAQDVSINWGELDAFVRIQDPQGPAFRLANKSLGGMRPIVVGALSPVHKHTYVTVAVFPDNDRSLYAVPPLWISDVGVQSGYFSVGPHVSRGQDLLPGRYRVLVASEGKFLGDASFDLGVFPLGDGLATKKTEIQSEVSSLASTEREALKAKIQVLANVQQKLPVLEPLALDGQPKRRAWNEQRAQLVKDLSELRDQQQKIVQGPMFFAQDQGLLLTSISSLDLYVQALESYSLGGAIEVKTKLSSTVQTLKGGLQTALLKLEASVKDIDTREITKPLTISAENIRIRLLEESK